MKKKNLFLFVSIFILSIALSSCAQNEYLKEEKELYVVINSVKDVFNIYFDNLKDLFGLNEKSEDLEMNIPELDIVKVTAADDKTYMRFDIYHKLLITGNYDVFYGFVEFWSDGSYDIFYYFAMTNDFYVNMYDKNDNLVKSISLDIEKLDATFYPWSFDKKDPYSVVSMVFNKKIMWGIDEKSVQNLRLVFVSGYYSKDEKKIKYIDVTPVVKIEFNH